MVPTALKSCDPAPGGKDITWCIPTCGKAGYAPGSGPGGGRSGNAGITGDTGRLSYCGGVSQPRPEGVVVAPAYNGVGRRKGMSAARSIA